MPPPALMDDLIGEILLRFPPGEPELLVRAALVSKLWCRLISDPGFRRRFRELHRTPPLLGFFCIRGSVPGFAPASSVGLPHAARGDWRAIDARHGRVLIHDCPSSHSPALRDLVVWDPVTDAQRLLPKPPSPPDHVFPYSCSWTASVLCAPEAGGGCDNLDCPHGSFLVVFVCTGARETFSCVYSSDSGAWSAPILVQLRHAWVRLGPSVLVENALYYVSDDCRRSNKILKLDLGTQEASLIRLPCIPYKKSIVLTATVDGGLGFVVVHESKLYLWSREAGPKAYAGWTQSRVVALDTLLGPIGALPDSLDVVCFVDGVAAAFRGTDNVFITIDMMSCRVKKICEGRCIYFIVPYTSFYAPALRMALTGEEPGAFAPIA